MGAVLSPEFIVQFGLPSEKILQAALDLRADLIFMGLRRADHVATDSQMPWTTAHDVACHAGCPVLTVRTGGEGATCSPQALKVFRGVTGIIVP